MTEREFRRRVKRIALQLLVEALGKVIAALDAKRPRDSPGDF